MNVVGDNFIMWDFQQPSQNTHCVYRYVLYAHIYIYIMSPGLGLLFILLTFLSRYDQSQTWWPIKIIRQSWILNFSYHILCYLLVYFVSFCSMKLLIMVLLLIISSDILLCAFHFIVYYCWSYLEEYPLEIIHYYYVRLDKRGQLEKELEPNIATVMNSKMLVSVSVKQLCCLFFMWALEPNAKFQSDILPIALTCQ